LDSSPTSISEIESGKYKPNLEFVIKLVDECNVSFYYLAFEEGKMFTESRNRGIDIPEKLFSHSPADIKDIMAFLKDMSDSPYLLLHMMSQYKNALIEREEIIQKDKERTRREKDSK
jgi:DNA-binding XRE family transcriptional regulator